jgi:hypothetical protein
MLLGQLTPACDRHRGCRHGVDVLADGMAVGLAGAELVRVPWWDGGLSASKHHSATGCVVAPGAGLRERHQLGHAVGEASRGRFAVSA